MNWQNRTMTPDQYAWYINKLGMTQAGAGRFLGISERTSRRYIRGEGEIPPAQALLLRSMYFHKDTPVVPKWTRFSS